MRRTLSCVLMMTLLLTGCKAGGGEDRAEHLAARIRAEYLSLTGWTAKLDVTADYGERVYEFSMDASWEKDGPTVLTVTAPELIAGITARVEDGEGILEYDGASLSTGPLTGDGMSPLEAVPFLMKELTEGYMAGTCYVQDGEKQVLEVLFRDPEAPAGLGAECVLRFDPESRDLLQAELFWDGTAVLRADVTEFTKEMTELDREDHAHLGGSEPGESGA